MFRYSISLPMLMLFPLLLRASERLPLVNHDLTVKIDPAESSIEVRDKIRLPQAVTSFDFLLHSGLNPKLNTEGAKLQFFGHYSGSVPGQAYRVTFERPQAVLEIGYAGQIQHPVDSGSRNQPGSRAAGTPGHISEKGVFLNASSLWYPFIQNRMLRFSMRVSLPDGWSSVSQGAPLTDGRGWQESSPQDDIYLIAGRYQVYSDTADPVVAQVYLRTSDEKLAQRYLQATGIFVELYQKLIGTYPYKKFAMVENFWESGYGMPSFTLLGPRVLRFPFILNSSYPHEILHNWWGNSVYVDYQGGNWSEGLTSYLADHLIKEQSGEGSGYRRDTLQRYADFVHDQNDFPLTEFSGRHGDVSQAVGYGKTLMFFHMLRLKLGDRTFVEGLRRFYRDNIYRIAGFNDLKSAFEASSQLSLGSFFEQWTTSTGAPDLQISETEVYRDERGYHVRGVLRQNQPGRLFEIDVPIVIQSEEKSFEIHRLPMHERSTGFDIPMQKRPLRLSIDPLFDLFRQLADGETPSSLSQLFGAASVTLVLPSAASIQEKHNLQTIASMWSGRWGASRTVWDDTLEALPDQGGILLFGVKNRFAPLFFEQLDRQQVSLTERELHINEQSFPTDDLSFALTAPHPKDRDSAIGLLHIASTPATEGFARKLPHYGKYSFSLFRGDEPGNLLKGQWQTADSALSIGLTGRDSLAPALIPDHAPLIDLPND